ncbi:MAG: hypothetical protein KBT58_02960 [Bizionia sp.]|nr:hypothetical protein [Bizionia sp.]
MNLDNIATDLLISFFRKLYTQNIGYAVLRNYELLPYDNTSKDVDLIFDPTDFEIVKSIVKEIAKKNNYKLIWENNLDYLYGCVFVKIKEDKVYSVKLDFFNGFNWHGCNYIDHMYIFDKTTSYNGFSVPNKGHEAFIMVVYYLLYAKSIKDKYHSEIYNNVKNHLTDFKEIVHNHFSIKTANKIIDLVSNNNIKELTALRKTIRNEVVSKNLRKKSIVNSYFKHFKCEVFDRRKMGFLIALSGPDGAGKSTLVQPFIDFLFDLGLAPTNIPHHFLTNNIPSLHKLPGAPKKYAKQNYTKPYEAKETGALSSLVRTGYYYLAFLADRWFYINKMMRSNQVVVFDRYYLDLVADPKRIRISLNKGFVARLFNVLPKPNCYIIVLADKDQILKRKDELTESKLTELLVSYAELPEKFDRTEVIYNNETLVEGKIKIFKTLFNQLENAIK